MTHTELREAHHRLGLSASKAAKLFGAHDGRAVRRWWSGETAAPPASMVILTKALIESEPVRQYFGVELDKGAPKSGRPPAEAE